MSQLKIVFCWSDISGYMVACWKALAALPGVELHIFAFGNNDQTNFDLTIAGGLSITLVDRSPDPHQLAARVAAFHPQVVVLCGWFVPAYRLLPQSRQLPGKVRFILAMDTPWWGTLRQQVGVFLLRAFVRKMDAVISSGERSYQYARRLGARQVMKIQYGVDVERLSQCLTRRLEKPWPKRFLFVGRYANEKGISVLLDAYRQYRRETQDAWPLHACGKGPLEPLLEGPGIVNHGFVQPDAMDTIWEESACLVLPSTFDPWPLIVVEACAAGLPVICTHASGSQVEVIKMYWNGLVINTNDPLSLKEAMAWMHIHYEQLPDMGRRSLEQARPYAATAWSEKFNHLLNRLN